MRINKLAILILMLSSGSTAYAAEASNHFIVACSLFSRTSGDAKARLTPHNLNLLVDGNTSEGGFHSVLDTSDPDKLTGSGKFTKAFFERSRFAALTGSVKEANTRMLFLIPRGSAEYDAMLSDVAKTQDPLKGRCWTSSVANADEEFEKLKVEEASQ